MITISEKDANFYVSTLVKCSYLHSGNLGSWPSLASKMLFHPRVPHSLGSVHPEFQPYFSSFGLLQGQLCNRNLGLAVASVLFVGVDLLSMGLGLYSETS